MQFKPGKILSRRRMLGGLLVGTGFLLSGFKILNNRNNLAEKGKVLLRNPESIPKGLEKAVNYPLIEALHNRRARRFSMGAEIPDGPLAYKSKHKPVPLSEMEQMMVLTASAGNTGWHYMITRNKHYAPHLANYSAAAGGRTFPSAAGFHTSDFFYTDDNGVYFLPTRDSGLIQKKEDDDSIDLNAWIEGHKKRIKKLKDGRLNIPYEEPYMEGHNTWCVNQPGSTLLIPVADVAQHTILILMFLVQNGFCIYDDLNNEKISGLEKFSKLVDVEHPYPLSFIEQYALTEVTAELSTSCYAGMLMLQALGLGGWMFDGIDRFTVLGASGNPDVPGLGFQFQTKENWPLPHITGLPGIFEGTCPPHYSTMRAAVDAVAERKFGNGGPFNAGTAGPWKESSRIRSSAQVHSEEFKECVSLMAQYIFDRYGKFPATVPAIFILTYLQAHHLDLDFYDKNFNAGAYLDSHKEHMKEWHS